MDCLSLFASFAYLIPWAPISVFMSLDYFLIIVQ